MTHHGNQALETLHTVYLQGDSNSSIYHTPSPSNLSPFAGISVDSVPSAFLSHPLSSHFSY